MRNKVNKYTDFFKQNTDSSTGSHCAFDPERCACYLLYFKGDSSVI